ncbi:NTPase KAP [Pseudoalteromonas distincta]|uniref:P-loop NTPase fold protein n=1 Tax=Pseudoalteromonas distincta TaxID=77608 RepID=A0ABT9GFH7_9GAMM|nr:MULTISPECIES: P-loop NTPase fold protein [Pseudoalteromonas distincta group]KHM47049.1 NTPase KAP [Pseudoalteromonas elyakovii]KID38432.1 NTPase KAP [Pseudoalteromonas distincta]MDP4484639.1 P-loop NTPase fold protein [Pseudoalteromonas elyakovii]
MKEFRGFNWDKPTNRNVNEYFPADKLDRARYAMFLSKLLVQEGFDKSRTEAEQKRNYVLNLNAEWGAGKTYFLKRWSQDLAVDYPIVYIDAWQQDYSDDPFLTVIAAIIEQLGKQASFTIKIPNKAASIFKAVAPAIAQGLTKKISGIDLAELNTLLFSEEDEESEDKDSVKQNSSEFSPAIKALAQNLIKDHEAKNKSIEVIKSKLADWVSKFEKQEDKSLPIFIFIDELDRCRPSYAVEMLETIKHIFDVKGIVFVVATDTEQLQHTIKSIYGEGFDAKIYLGRFFNSRYSLKRPVLKDFLSVHSDTTKFESAHLKSKKIEILPRTKTPETALANISVVLDAFQVSPRTAIQITERITAIIVNLPSGKKVDVLVLAILFCIHEKDHPLYEEIISGLFQRKEPNSKGNMQNISLSSFLQKNILEKHFSAELTYFIDPDSYTNQFHHDNLGTKVNNYYEGDYPIPLSKFIENIFCSIFVLESNAYDGWISDSDNGLTELQNAENNLAQHSIQTSPEVTLLWLDYIYIKDEYNKITKEQYRDFIELSSPLDYMGDS